MQYNNLCQFVPRTIAFVSDELVLGQEAQKTEQKFEANFIDAEPVKRITNYNLLPQRT